MKYPRLLLRSSPQKMNSELENFYGYGLYEFSASIAVMNRDSMFYDPYNKNKIVEIEKINVSNDLRSFIEKEEKKYNSEFQSTLYEILKKYDFKHERTKEFIEENEDYKINTYINDCSLDIPLKLLNLPRNEVKKLEELKFTTLSYSVRKLRYRIGGIWAGVIKKKGEVHWENISTLLSWFAENLGQTFETILGNTETDSIKQWYRRHKEIYKIYFEIIKKAFFPGEKKNPFWTFWFGEDFIMWVSPYLYSDKYYNWIKKKKIKELLKRDPNLPYFGTQIIKLNDTNRKTIGLNELKNLFKFCYGKQLSELPLIIFPNGKTFP